MTLLWNLKNEINPKEFEVNMVKDEKVKKPISMSIDITNKCNLRCIHCFNRSGNDLTRDELTDDEFLSIIKDMAKIKAFSFCFCGGEPMTRFDLLEKSVKILKDAGTANVNVVSNGILITDEKVKRLKKAGIDMVQISVDGATKEHHERVRGVDGAYEGAINALELLEKNKVNHCLAFSATYFNVGDVEKVFNYISKHKYFLMMRMQPLMPLGRATEEILPSEDQYRELVDTINNINFREKRKKIEWGDPVDHIIRGLKHLDSSNSFNVRSNGKVYVSPYLPVIVGDLRKHSLQEYLDNGMSKVWHLPCVRNIAKHITSVNDMGKNENIPEIYRDSDYEIDLIDDKDKIWG